MLVVSKYSLRFYEINDNFTKYSYLQQTFQKHSLDRKIPKIECIKMIKIIIRRIFAVDKGKENIMQMAI